jgi:hypothetical protein
MAGRTRVPVFFSGFPRCSLGLTRCRHRPMPINMPRDYIAAGLTFSAPAPSCLQPALGTCAGASCQRWHCSSTEIRKLFRYPYSERRTARRRVPQLLTTWP